MSAQHNDGRPRRFRVSSQTLTRASIVSALDRPNVKRYAGIVHDRDPDVKTHSHVVFELIDGRTVTTVANMLDVPQFLVLPVFGTKGDRYSFARAIRYFLHESPTEQAKGKARYTHDGIFASEGFDWKAEVDALNAREGHQPPLLDRIKMEVLHGKRSVRSVLDDHPEIYVRHYGTLEKLEKQFFDKIASAEQREAVLHARRDDVRRRLGAP